MRTSEKQTSLRQEASSAAFSGRCDKICDNFDPQKTYMRTGKIKGRTAVIVISFVIIGLMSLKLYYNLITKNPAPQLPKKKPKHGKLSSKTKQYLEKQKNKKQPPTARSLSAVHGAPNRIRTCGLLIRSQTLYPAELWVRIRFSTEGILSDVRRVVNTFLKFFLFYSDFSKKSRYRFVTVFVTAARLKKAICHKG